MKPGIGRYDHQDLGLPAINCLLEKVYPEPDRKPVYRNGCHTALSLAERRPGNEFLLVWISRLAPHLRPWKKPDWWGNISQDFFRCIIRFTRFYWIQTGFSGSGNYLFLFLKWSPEWDFQNWEWAVFLPISVFSRIFLSEIVSEKILWIHNFDFPIYRYNRRKLNFKIHLRRSSLFMDVLGSVV